MAWRRWLEQRRQRRRDEKEARRLLAQAFRSPRLLAGTSLKPRHGNRCVLLGQERSDGAIAKVWFGILRHPRPYPFSQQSHKVIEHYVYDVTAERVSVERGYNVTRERGSDADA